MSNNPATARNRALWPEERATAGELEMLQPAHLDALRNDKDIRNALKTKELQELIKNIDGSRCRLEALAAAQHNVPAFKKFCDQVLGSVYAAEDESHRYRT